MSLEFTPAALADIKDIIKFEPKSIRKRLLQIFEELELQPRIGKGKPKQLTGNLKGFWSRRLSDKHRVIYSINDDKVIVTVIRARGHYYDK